jgi:hypothetical protein
MKSLSVVAVTDTSGVCTHVVTCAGCCMPACLNNNGRFGIQQEDGSLRNCRGVAPDSGAKSLGHPYQIRKISGVHLAHHFAAMRFHRDFANTESAADLFV